MKVLMLVVCMLSLFTISNNANAYVYFTPYYSNYYYNSGYTGYYPGYYNYNYYDYSYPSYYTYPGVGFGVSLGRQHFGW